MKDWLIELKPSKFSQDPSHNSATMSSLVSQTISCSNCGYPLISPCKNYTSPSAQSLHSSTVISIEGIQNHRKTVLDIQSELSRVDSEMTRVQIILDQLECERQRLLESLTQYQALASPIRRLPTEILSSIFTTIPRDQPFDMSNSPMLLTRICSRWRDVAISTPRMWNYIDFYVDEQLNTKPFTITMWKVWLSRSGSCPLHIKVSFQPPKTSHFPYRPIVDMLASCSRRWRQIFFRIPFSLGHFSAVKGSIPILKVFTVLLTSTSVELRTLAILEDAPNLSSLSIESASLVLTPHQLPWAQLTWFCGVDLLIESHISILRYCRNLVGCHLFCRHPPRISSVSAFPVIMHTLRELHIHTVYSAFCGYIFDSLSCPSLINLCIDPPMSTTAILWPQDRLSSFLARSSCTLRRLSLGNISLENPSLVDCLGELPSLFELHIREINTIIPTVTSPLFDRMTHGRQFPVGDQPKILVPMLKVFRLDNTSAPKSEVLAMIRSRWNLMEVDNIGQNVQGTSSLTRLKSVHLGFRHKHDCEQLARARDLRDEGLDIRITVGGERWV